jgi:acetyltransferase-like isoleucine patch superfamily enzyme
MHDGKPTTDAVVERTLHPKEFFDLGRDDTGKIFQGVSLVWEVLARLPALVAEMVGDGQTIRGEVMPGAVVSDRPVFIAEGARIEPGAYVKGPAYIGPSVVVRHGAYVRENCIFFEGSLLGHASEAKNALFLAGAKAPHFCYVGDSVLGHDVNLGAGTKLSNVPVTTGSSAARGHRKIALMIEGTPVDTGLRKLGAILGDGVQTGCNAVFNPGALVGRTPWSTRTQPSPRACTTGTSSSSSDSNSRTRSGARRSIPRG